MSKFETKARKLLKRAGKLPLIGGGLLLGGLVVLALASRRGLLPAIHTEFDGPDDFVHRVHTAYREAGASQVAAPLLTAHSGLATGFGRTVYNNNIGVIKANAFWVADGRPYHELFGPEHIGGMDLRIKSKWRSYGSLTESAADVLRLLSSSFRYERAWAMLNDGDPGWYLALGQAGYYNQPPHEHTAYYQRNSLPFVERTLA